MSLFSVWFLSMSSYVFDGCLEVFETVCRNIRREIINLCLRTACNWQVLVFVSHDKHINHKNNMLKFRAVEKMQLSNKWVLVFASHGKHINHNNNMLRFRALENAAF